MILRPTFILGLLVAVALTGCGSGPQPVPADSTASPAVGLGDAGDATEPEGRLGWRIVFTNILGAHQPQETCGGDYVLRRGTAGSMYPDIIDEQGLEGPPPDSPTYAISLDPDGVMRYSWISGKFTWEEAPGSPSQGSGRIEFDSDGDGHPDPTVTATGGMLFVVDAQLAWETRPGEDVVSLTFERIPEPEWCVGDEAYNLPFDDEFTWHYYD